MPGPVPIGCNVAARAVGVTGVVKGDYQPVGGVVAGDARVQVVVLWRQVAELAVGREEDVIDRGHNPGGGHVAVGAGAFIVRRGYSMAIQALIVAGMVEVDVFPRGDFMAA